MEAVSSQLKKKHNAIAFSRIREATAMSIVSLGHIKSEHNLSDICTKALNGTKLHGITKKLLFRGMESGECKGLTPITKQGDQRDTRKLSVDSNNKDCTTISDNADQSGEHRSND